MAFAYIHHFIATQGKGSVDSGCKALRLKNCHVIKPQNQSMLKIKKKNEGAQSASSLLWLKTEKLPRVVSWWPEHAPILPQTAATSFQCHLVNFFLFNFTQHFLDMSIIYFCLLMCSHTNTNSIFMELYDDGLRPNSRQEIAFIWQKRCTWQKCINDEKM